MTFDVQKELEQLVSFKTVNDARTGQKPTLDCPRYISSKLEQQGFMTDILESKNFYTVLGKRGHGSFKILYLAHFDVVPPGDGWTTDPFTLAVNDDKAFGRGSSDNKGNVVSLLMLAEKFKENELPCTLMIAASGDEEIGGANGAKYLREYLIKNGLFPDYVVIADGINQVIIHRRRNALPTEIKVKQKQSKMRGQLETVRLKTDTFGSESRHSAYMRPGVDRHAMLAASKYLDLNGFSAVQSIHGAFVKSNVVPDWVELDVVHPDPKGNDLVFDDSLTQIIRSLLPLSQAPFHTDYSDLGTIVSPNLLYLDGDMWNLYCDVRAMTNDHSSVEEAFQKALAGKVNVFSLKVHPGAGYVNSDPGSRLIRAAEWALKKEAIRYKLMEGFGASDSRFFSDSAQVFDFGPRGGNIHGPNEWVSLSSIGENAAFFYRVIDVLCRNPASL